MTPESGSARVLAGRSFEEGLERQNRELAILNNIATALNGSADLASALSTVLSRVGELLGLSTGWILLLDERTGEPYLAAAQDLPPGLEAPERMQGTCYCLETFREGDLNGAANINVVACSRLSGLASGAGGLRVHASIPLRAGETKLGVMNLASPGWRQLSSDDLRILHTIGDMLGIAIERARLLEGSLEAGASEERNRIAREIHDTLAQGLSATALQLETAEALLEHGADQGRVRDAVHRALETTRQNLVDARRSVFDLRAGPVAGKGLAEALAELCSSHAQGTGPPVVFSAAGTSRPIPTSAETALYRVAQEALSNALRHAQATRIEVGLRADPSRVTLTVRDDGVGFEVCQRRAGRFGLVGMRERVRLLGGDLCVYSQAGEGTHLEAAVPLEGAGSAESDE